LSCITSSRVGRIRTSESAQAHRCRGLSGVCNCGIEAVGGSLVAFLDDVAVPDWLEEIAAL
jgi:hypothetical protein